MHLTTEGIVIQTIRHTDNKLIVRLLCKEIGYKSCVIRNSRRPNASMHHIFQPLRIIEFDCNFQEVNKFITPQSPRLVSPLHNLGTDPVKIAIAFFMNELLAKTLAEDYGNDSLFEFLKNSIILLDDAVDVKNFHVWWLIEITRHYGFYPMKSSGQYFDLRQGLFVDATPGHPDYLASEVTEVLHQLLDLEWPQAQQIELHSSIRRELLQALVTYLKLHLSNLREIKSLDVLHAVFH